jgi:hypothetical protein
MAGDGMLPSDFFRRNVVLSFQEDSHRHSPARRHRPRQHDVGQRGVGLGLSAQRVDVSQSRKILAGVPDDEQAKPAPDHDPGIAAGNTARVYNFDMARLTVPA